MFGALGPKLRTSIFRPSGASAAPGFVPRPSLTSNTTSYLREDATWVVPPFDNGKVDGRLTITSGDPYNVTGTSSGSTIYFTPCLGNFISVYSGTSWVPFTLTEISIAAPGSTGVYDVFVYNNAGTLTLETLAWSTTTARATAIVYQDGVYVKSGAATRRYLGTVYSISGSISDSNTARNMWSHYNRATKKLYNRQAGTFTTTGTSTWTIVNADSGGGSHVTVVNGLQEEMALIGINTAYATSGTYESGIAYDSIANIVQDFTSLANAPSGSVAIGFHTTGIGFHTYYWANFVVSNTGNADNNNGGFQGVYIC